MLQANIAAYLFHDFWHFKIVFHSYFDILFQDQQFETKSRFIPPDSSCQSLSRAFESELKRKNSESACQRDRRRTVRELNLTSVVLVNSVLFNNSFLGSVVRYPAIS